MSSDYIRNLINILENIELKTSLIKQITEEYSLDELFTFENSITEDMENLKPLKMKNGTLTILMPLKKD